MALRNILWDVFNGVEIHSYNNMDSFIRDSNRHFVHFFVSTDILFTCADEFEMLKAQTTAISCGGNKLYKDSGFKVLDITLPEHELLMSLACLQTTGRFFGIAFLWDWNENRPFPVLWPLLSFPNMLA